MDPIELQAETVAQKVRHYLITTMGRTADEANDEEFYRAFCTSLREEIMINWTATTHTLKKKGLRKLYYLSMEYMPGRLFGNNITNLNAEEFIKRILKRLGRDMTTIINMEHDIGIGNGGLGRLASCFMDSLATLQYPAMGYGMRYQYGIFEQELICGVQVERPDCWLLTPNPWEFRRDTHAVPVQFAGKPVKRTNSHGDEVYDLIDCEEVRALPYDLPIIGYSDSPDFSVLTLRLWSTKESPRNFQLQRYNAGELGQASENTSLTDVLYPNDNHDAGKRIRLKQEFLLVSASLQDIVNQYKEVHPNFDGFADAVRIQINDTHPALIIPEMMQLLTKNNDLPWGKAWEIIRTCCAYTNHTVLKEALEDWNAQRLGELLPRNYSILERMNGEFCAEVRKTFPGDEERVRRMSIIEGGQVKMANLSIYGSNKVNGVAALHTEILKASLFKDFYEMYPDKFVNVTNGVTQRRWLLHCNPLLSAFLEKRIGKGWITNFEEIAKLKDFASDPETQQEFLAIKRKNKERLLKMIEEDMEFRHGHGKNFAEENFLSADALFDVQIKRIHEYKRQLMKALHLLMVYFEMKENPDSHRIQRFAMIGGKAAPGYHVAKSIIRLFYCLGRTINRDPVVGKKLKVIYLENYNVSKAEVIIPGTDLSEQISTAGMEASGTGNMKFSINGALTIATDDGANVEMRQQITDEWWPFMFGASSNENLEMRRSHSYNPLDVYTSEPKIKQAVDALKDRSLVENDAEHESLMAVYRSLLEGMTPDAFFVLNDLMAYYETQKKVEELYQDPNRWAEFALHNIAGMGAFSADVSIKNYAEKIWEINPCPPDPKELKQVRKEYSEHDRCRVIPS
ncbi:glycogen/starch/alpha-glucan phosphorylase [Candidatus Neptunochlamydia vexilliferae]|nr:glycogen/starch/alpha-glucan phosphorylase [Candidatus Neptunochlamydia vexilliferae]